MNPPLDRYAVVGNPVSHSLSPQIHALFAKQTGQKLIYETLLAPLDSFKSIVNDFFTHGGRGLNVTIPFKQEAAALCRQLSLQARETMAVNTLWMEDDQICGDSTDGPGLVNDLSQRCGVDLAGARILVLGAGGTVASILPSLLAQSPEKLVIANRTLSSAQALADHYAGISAYDLHIKAQAFDIIINATSLSLQSQCVPIDDDIYAQCHVYYDCLYGKKVAPVLAEIKKKGSMQVFDGLGMLVEQAALSFALWRGVLPDTEPVYAALKKNLA